MKLLTALLLPGLLFISCDRKKTDPIAPPPRNCRLVEQYMHPWSTEYGYKLTYIYTGDQLTRIDDSRNGYATLAYTDNRLSRRDNFHPGIVGAISYELIHYNADGTVNTLEHYTLSAPQNSSYVRDKLVVFGYAGGKMINVTTYNGPDGALSKQQEYVYTYSGENITQVDYTRHWDGGSGYSYKLSYDNLENYIRKRGTYAWLYTYVWDEYYGDFVNGDGIARAQSANNALMAYGGSTLYTADENQNLSLVWRGNQIDERYIYSCR